MTDQTEVTAEDEVEVEPGDHELAEEEEAPTSQGGGTPGISDDVKVLNERLGYPIGEEATSGEPEVGEVGAEGDDGAEAEAAGAVPDADSTVDEIKAYLDSQGTSYTSSMRKDELLALV